MSVKINSLELENVKRIKAVQLEPQENGLTVIGGGNGQGKTSVLDAIAWALGGDRYRPGTAKRDGSLVPPAMRVELSNGIVVERRGENSTLKVTDPTGARAGQTLLSEFIEELAINLPRFLQSSNAEKARTLLRIIGVEDKLSALNREEKRLYDERYTVGRMAEQKEKFALEMPHYDGVPDVPVSASELIKRQQDILAENGENRRKRDNLANLEREKARLDEQFHAICEKLTACENDLRIAKASAADLEDKSTAELEKSIADIENLNIRIRANLDKERAYGEAEELKDRYKELSGELDKVRHDRIELLDGADLPLPELSVDNGELTYKGKTWDCMSGSEQLKVAAAIVRKLKPECGFVLVDKLEQMDTDTLSDFGKWCESEGLQVIATRVSKGDECSVIIEDGYIKETPHTPAPAAKWKDGEF